MGRKVIDRTGEESHNNFGSKMVIKEYRGRNRWLNNYKNN